MADDTLMKLNYLNRIDLLSDINYYIEIAQRSVVFSLTFCFKDPTRILDLLQNLSVRSSKWGKQGRENVVWCVGYFLPEMWVTPVFFKQKIHQLRLQLLALSVQRRAPRILNSRDPFRFKDRT